MGHFKARGHLAKEKAKEDTYLATWRLIINKVYKKEKEGGGEASVFTHVLECFLWCNKSLLYFQECLECFYFPFCKIFPFVRFPPWNKSLWFPYKFWECSSLFRDIFLLIRKILQPQTVSFFLTPEVGNETRLCWILLKEPKRSYLRQLRFGLKEPSKKTLGITRRYLGQNGKKVRKHVGPFFFLILKYH